MDTHEDMIHESFTADITDDERNAIIAAERKRFGWSYHEAFGLGIDNTLIPELGDLLSTVPNLSEDGRKAASTLSLQRVEIFDNENIYRARYGNPDLIFNNEDDEREYLMEKNNKAVEKAFRWVGDNLKTVMKITTKEGFPILKVIGSAMVALANNGMSFPAHYPEMFGSYQEANEGDFNNASLRWAEDLRRHGEVLESMDKKNLPESLMWIAKYRECLWD